MEHRPFGKSGLTVSALGLGAGHIGSPELSEDAVARLLHGAVDIGVNLIDSARSYGLSEERIGRHLAGRRHKAVLSTKVGYGIPGFQDWTGPCISAGIDAALGRLQTDVIDIVHLHSCPAEVALRADIQEALTRARDAGKIRVAAYSGDNDALQHSIDSGRFGSIQASLNLCDQAVLKSGVPAAVRGGLGVIAKRPLANAPWRFDTPPDAQDMREYWQRFRSMALDPRGLPWDELALRFTAFTPGVSTCIVGTSNIAHLGRCAEILQRGPLPGDVEAGIRDSFRRNGRDWMGQV